MWSPRSPFSSVKYVDKEVTVPLAADVFAHCTDTPCGCLHIESAFFSLYPKRYTVRSELHSGHALPPAEVLKVFPHKTLLGNS